MENILYLDEYINFYINDLKNIVSIKPYKNTLYKGKIIDRNKFIKNFTMLKEDNKLNNFIFNKKINIIINSTYTKEDKLLLQEVMEELEYNSINFINELDLIKIDKNCIFIIFNYTYFYLYYLNDFGNTEIKIYDNDFITKEVLNEIINVINKKKIIVTGKNYQELINVLKKYNKNFYYFEENNNLFIYLLLQNNSV